MVVGVWSEVSSVELLSRGQVIGIELFGGIVLNWIGTNHQEQSHEGLKMNNMK